MSSEGVLDPDHAVAAVRVGYDDALATLEDLVRIPSISADPARSKDVEHSADAVAALLEVSGLEGVRELTVDDSPPYVVGEWMHAPDAPTVLLYAHHDVQPPGIVERWNSDPFEPRVVNGRLYGRGTADDKAGVVAHAAVVRAWLDAAKALPCNVKVLVEGEEEIGSPRLAAFLTRHVRMLAADVLVLADAGNWSVGVPGLTYSLRGLAAVDISVRALDGPVHSGMAGGAVPDPMTGLASVLASLVDTHGDVAIDDFWADVRQPSVAERARLAALPVDEEYLRAAWGVRPGVQLAGDPTVPVWERLWHRPAVTVIGLDAHPIAGSSNQVLARATARVSLRLAPGQDSQRCVKALETHVQRRVPWGLELTFEAHEAVPAWSCEPEGWAFDAATRALRAGFSTDPVLMGVGGTIPFVGPFASAFGDIPALLLGPADPASRIHGEDESLHLDDWRKLMESEARLLAEIATLAPRR